MCHKRSYTTHEHQRYPQPAKGIGATALNNRHISLYIQNMSYGPMPIEGVRVVVDVTVPLTPSMGTCLRQLEQRRHLGRLPRVDADRDER